MPEPIKAEERPIGKVFCDAYRFEIPNYQRSYAWTTDQASDLFDDLWHAVRDIPEQEDIKDAQAYFLGSIVVIKEDSSLAHLAHVVDGQQRITTLTIMFCALRELANYEDQRRNLDDFIREPGNKIKGIEGHYRVTVRERDKEFFINNIQEMGKLAEFVQLPDHVSSMLPDSQQRMFENAKLLWNKLSELDDNKRQILAAFLVQCCYLVVVAASSEDSAHRIFAVMNDRGLDLSPTDILKSKIIGPMADDAGSKYTEAWEDIEERVGREKFIDLFSYIRMIHLKTKLHETLQRDFQEKILNGRDGANFIDETLNPYAEVYEVITQASYQSASDADKVNGLLRSLNRLKNSDWIPPAMAFFKDNPHDTDALIRFVRDLERLAYGLFLIRANRNERINRYADVLRAIERSDEPHQEGAPLQLSSEEKDEILKALDSQIYDQKIRPLLLRLDGLLADAGATYDHRVISIEHVLPQNPAADSEWMINFTDDQRTEWTGKLANLVLLSRNKNSRAQNYDFDRKKTEYFQGKSATFALTTQVVEESEWTPEVLDRRQRNLIAELSKEWRLEE